MCGGICDGRDACTSCSPDATLDEAISVPTVSDRTAVHEVSDLGRAKNKRIVLLLGKEVAIGKQTCICASRGRSVRRVAEDRTAGVRVFLSFFRHCWRRGTYVERTIRQSASFEEMLLCMSPLAADTCHLAEKMPDGWIARTGEYCAYFFPRMWRRRCLFRSLLVLDWARRSGISPTLNVGMQLGPDRDQGHCWLSIGDRPFCESAGWPRQYGILFHRGNDVQYWTSLIPDAQDSV